MKSFKRLPLYLKMRVLTEMRILMGSSFVDICWMLPETVYNAWYNKSGQRCLKQIKATRLKAFREARLNHLCCLIEDGSLKFE